MGQEPGKRCLVWTCCGADAQIMSVFLFFRPEYIGLIYSIMNNEKRGTTSHVCRSLMAYPRDRWFDLSVFGMKDLTSFLKTHCVN